MAERATLQLDVISDAICPWCFIGKRRLERAAAILAADGVDLAVRWLPFQLNPDMPKAGMERAAYRTRKFGSLERSQQLDAQVAAAGREAGLTFRFERMTRTPNTTGAHRLIWLAGFEGMQEPVVEALFQGYFVDGRDLGDTGVLAEIAATAGLDPNRVSSFLAGDEGRAEVAAEELAARRLGVQGVPTFAQAGRALFSGAHPGEVIAARLKGLAGRA